KLDIQPANNNQENNTSISEEYSPKDGHENNRQLDVIARSILICKDIVNLWKKIGIIKSADTMTIYERLTELIDIGFQLNHRVILDILLVFEERLEVGKTLIESLAETRH
ncbi:1417_t:CDS:2, partial [Cetraspora pellucida]